MCLVSAEICISFILKVLFRDMYMACSFANVKLLKIKVTRKLHCLFFFIIK